jgi:hypothetical protein
MPSTSLDVLDRKLFYVQSKLLESNYSESDEKVLSEALLWFQPRHYLEVIEERSNDSRCGYPICSNSIVRPSDVSSILKISYREKRLYEIGRSKLFCSCKCLQKSAIFEASLPETHPASRQVSVDFLSQLSDKSSAAAIDTLPKNYFHGDPSAEANTAEIIRTSPSAKSAKSPIMVQRAAEIVVPNSTGKVAQSILKPKSTPNSKTAPSATPSSIPIMSFNSENYSSSSVSSLPILNYSTATTSKSKEVKFVDMKSLGSSVAEKWADSDVPKVLSKRTSVTKKSSLQSLDYTSISDIQARVSSLTVGAIFEKPSVLPSPVLNISSDENPIGTESAIEGNNITSVRNDNKLFRQEIAVELEDADSAEGKDAAANEDDSEYDEDEDRIDDTEGETDGDGDGDYLYRDSAEDISLFMLMWTTLDDLFGESISIICETTAPPVPSPIVPTAALSIVSDVTAIAVRGTGERVENTAIERSAEDDIIEEQRQSIDPTLLASQRSVAMFVERGFHSAEKACGLLEYLDVSSVARYHHLRGQILLNVGMNETACPRLKSSEFTFLALLVIDALVTCQSLLTGISLDFDAVSNRWGDRFRSSVLQILRVRSGRQIEKENSRNLREGDLELLRNFFTRKLL